MSDRKNRKILFAVVLVVLLGVVWYEFGSTERRLLQQMKSSNPDDRYAAIRGLEQVGSTKAIAAIEEHINDADQRVASRAIVAMGVLGRQEPVKKLEKVTTDARIAAREAAAVALGRSPAALQVDYQVLVNQLSGDQSPIVRAAAASALGRRHAVEALPALIAALGDPDIAVRQRVGEAIRLISKQPLEFPPAGTEEERQQAAERIQAWWNSSGLAASKK